MGEGDTPGSFPRYCAPWPTLFPLSLPVPVPLGSGAVGGIRGNGGGIGAGVIGADLVRFLPGFAGVGLGVVSVW